MNRTEYKVMQKLDAALDKSGLPDHIVDAEVHNLTSHNQKGILGADDVEITLKARDNPKHPGQVALVNRKLRNFANDLVREGGLDPTKAPNLEVNPDEDKKPYSFSSGNIAHAGQHPGQAIGELTEGLDRIAKRRNGGSQILSTNGRAYG